MKDEKYIFIMWLESSRNVKLWVKLELTNRCWLVKTWFIQEWRGLTLFILGMCWITREGDKKFHALFILDILESWMHRFVVCGSLYQISLFSARSFYFRLKLRSYMRKCRFNIIEIIIMNIFEFIRLSLWMFCYQGLKPLQNYYPLFL